MEAAPEAARVERADHDLVGDGLAAIAQQAARDHDARVGEVDCDLHFLPRPRRPRQFAGDGCSVLLRQNEQGLAERHMTKPRPAVRVDGGLRGVAGGHRVVLRPQVIRQLQAGQRLAAHRRLGAQTTGRRQLHLDRFARHLHGVDQDRRHRQARDRDEQSPLRDLLALFHSPLHRAPVLHVRERRHAVRLGAQFAADAHGLVLVRVVGLQRQCDANSWLA